MIRINQLKTETGADIDRIRKKAASKCRIPEKKILSLRILKKSVDARKKDNIREVYSLYIETSLSGAEEEQAIKRAASKDVLKYEICRYEPVLNCRYKPEKRPVIAGFGPAGIFLGLILSLNGFCPVILERGKSAEERKSDVERFFETGVLDLKSNAQFGEGGAGAFSDGKLNTLVRDEKGRSRFILETFVRFGAPEEILYDAKPHVGTDKLMQIIPGIRSQIEKNGGEVRFNNTLTGVETENNSLRAVIVNGTERIETDKLFLCPGHSARDTLRMLNDSGVRMEPKAFAIGVRTEHEREMIDKALHQKKASYKLTHKCRDGRGVYSFCMCPGGYVINASSSRGELCVNGMSYSGRNGANSNSAIVVTVSPEDFLKDGEPLSGIKFQEELEKKAFDIALGKIPYQRYGDFVENRASSNAGKISPQCKGDHAFCNLRSILPDYVSEDIIEGMSEFGRRIRGFDGEDTLFSGVESRTSSPVRIVRNKEFESSISGICPVGEGAGYAGGIMSAAMDGMRCAEVYLREFI